MNLRVWDTRNKIDPDFEAAWKARLSRSPHANFTLDAGYLAFDRRQSSLAVLADDRGRGAALVLRRANGGFQCGWPWRWQAVVEGSRPELPGGLDQDDAQWLYEAAREVAGRRRLHFHVPVAPPSNVVSYPAGLTLLYAIDHSDEELMRSMHDSKRAMVRRARHEGYEVVESREPTHLRVFGDLVRQTRARHGLSTNGTFETDEGWREWELPWMWLLLAFKNGKVESGLGDGIHPGGVVEGRAAGSSMIARKGGAFALLSYEEARRARDRGYRWINLGGNSVFKREMAGKLAVFLTQHCWLGGGTAGVLGSRALIVLERARTHVQRVARSMRVRTRAILVNGEATTAFAMTSFVLETLGSTV